MNSKATLSANKNHDNKYADFYMISCCLFVCSKVIRIRFLNVKENLNMAVLGFYSRTVKLVITTVDENIFDRINFHYCFIIGVNLEGFKDKRKITVIIQHSVFLYLCK